MRGAWSGVRVQAEAAGNGVKGWVYHLLQNMSQLAHLSCRRMIHAFHITMISLSFNLSPLILGASCHLQAGVILITSPAITDVNVVDVTVGVLLCVWLCAAIH